MTYLLTQVRKLRLRKVKELVRGHIANERKRRMSIFPHGDQWGYLSNSYNYTEKHKLLSEHLPKLGTSPSNDSSL